MKVILLAGGWGTRLGYLAEFLPKPMVKIGEKPILWHIMKIYAHFGFKEFIVCLGVKAEVIKDYFYHYNIKNNDFSINLKNRKIQFLNSLETEDWNVTLIDTGLNTLKGGRIKRVEKYLDPEMNMVTYGDCLANIDINNLVNFHKSHKKMFSLTGVYPPSRFGELIEKDGRVLAFDEKPQTSVGLINGGFMVFNNEFLDYITPDENCDLERGILEDLSKKGELMVYKHDGLWECMDNERDVTHLNSLWYNNKAFWRF